MRRSSVGLIVCLVLGVGCDSATGPQLPERRAYGPAFAVRAPTSTSPSDSVFVFHAKLDPEEECGILFTVVTRGRYRSAGVTEIFERSVSGDLVEAGPEEITVGRRINAWAVGDVVRRSCPGQAVAEAVELLPS